LFGWFARCCCVLWSLTVPLRLPLLARWLPWWSVLVCLWALLPVALFGGFPVRLCGPSAWGFVMSSVSLVLGSHSASFGCALRFLSRVAVGGDLSLGFCSYGTGSCYVSFVPAPAVAAVWPAVASLAFVTEEDGVGDLEFVASWSVGLNNSRAQALEALLEAVGV
jgi:hypothetical protein